MPITVTIVLQRRPEANRLRIRGMLRSPSKVEHDFAVDRQKEAPVLGITLPEPLNLEPLSNRNTNLRI